MVTSQRAPDHRLALGIPRSNVCSVDFTVPVDRRDEHGPFDLIGDVHGCYDELRTLLDRLGYRVDEDTRRDRGRFRVTPPQRGSAETNDRKLVFLGDLVDRGPNVPEVVRLAMDAVDSDAAICIAGNHEYQMLRRFDDPNASDGWGLAETLAQLAQQPRELTERVDRFARHLPSYLFLDDGKLIVSHAGLPLEYHAEVSDEGRWFALYGTPHGTGRQRWAHAYHGEPAIVYGHTPVDAPTWTNNTINVDTGCVYGGSLTALRWPERELVTVPAQGKPYGGW